jgi:hypothetical protein
MSCQGSSQVTDFASLASALARFGKVGREATNQKVGSSSPPGRTTLKPTLCFTYATFTELIGTTFCSPSSPLSEKPKPTLSHHSRRHAASFCSPLA